jgi:hypothetical protein
LGSLLASHTLLAAPIVVRLGETRLEPILGRCALYRCKELPER